MLLVTERALGLQLGLDHIERAGNDARSNAGSGTTETVDVWLGQSLSQEGCGVGRGFVEG
jgi:hypothetical protein